MHMYKEINVVSLNRCDACKLTNTDSLNRCDNTCKFTIPIAHEDVVEPSLMIRKSVRDNNQLIQDPIKRYQVSKGSSGASIYNSGNYFLYKK